MIKFENKNNGRYYYLYVQKDLLNDFSLIILRGGRFSSRVHHIGFSSFIGCERAISRITKRRIKRGYEIVSSQNSIFAA